MKFKNKLLILTVFLFSIVSLSDFLDDVQKITALSEKQKYDEAEAMANQLLADPNITNSQKSSLNNLIAEIRKQKSQNKGTQGEKQPEGAVAGETPEAVEPNAETQEELTNEQKFEVYDSYEQGLEASGYANGEAIFRLCNLYYKDGLYEKALNLAKKDKSGYIKNQFVIATSSRLLGKYNQSIEYYKKVLSNSPSFYEANLGMGIAYKSQGDFDSAIIYFERALSTNPSKMLYKQIINLQIARGNLSAGRSYYQKAVSLYGNSADLKAFADEL